MTFRSGVGARPVTASLDVDEQRLGGDAGQKTTSEAESLVGSDAWVPIARLIHVVSNTGTPIAPQATKTARTRSVQAANDAFARPPSLGQTLFGLRRHCNCRPALRAPVLRRAEVYPQAGQRPSLTGGRPGRRALQASRALPV